MNTNIEKGEAASKSFLENFTDENEKSLETLSILIQNLKNKVERIMPIEMKEGEEIRKAEIIDNSKKTYSILLTSQARKLDYLNSRLNAVLGHLESIA